MSPRQESPTDFSWSSTRLNAEDFEGGEADGTTQTAGSLPAELAKAEVGDDNGVDSQLASYRLIRPGGETDARGLSGQGKLYISLKSGADADLDDRTQVRLIKRPKNGDDRTKLTQWFSVRDLDVSDTRQRVPFPPITSDTGNPVVVQEGDVIAVEIRNEAVDITPSLANSTLEIPSQVGY